VLSPCSAVRGAASFPPPPVVPGGAVRGHAWVRAGGAAPSCLLPAPGRESGRGAKAGLGGSFAEEAVGVLPSRRLRGAAEGRVAVGLGRALPQLGAPAAAAAARGRRRKKRGFGFFLFCPHCAVELVGTGGSRRQKRVQERSSAAQWGDAEPEPLAQKISQ